jgi:hypothetical protein
MADLMSSESETNVAAPAATCVRASFASSCRYFVAFLALIVAWAAVAVTADEALSRVIASALVLLSGGSMVGVLLRMRVSGVCFNGDRISVQTLTYSRAVTPESVSYVSWPREGNYWRRGIRVVAADGVSVWIAGRWRWSSDDWQTLVEELGARLRTSPCRSNAGAVRLLKLSREPTSVYRQWTRPDSRQ